MQFSGYELDSEHVLVLGPEEKYLKESSHGHHGPRIE